MKKRIIHLICNAHLDPVWLWQWQEGAAEALSTFRTAAELCENDVAFIFNHNEAILYKWVQEYEPSLFERIQRLVKRGRWHIMGGWYIQPDCNMLSGESFVRQILIGKAYFKDHFDVEPTTAINFDSFGHTRGLVQILVKSGYDSYLFGRPGPDDLKLPQEEFIWVGYDDSEIMATRFVDCYNSSLGKAKEIIAGRIKKTCDSPISVVLWGVGNHGGGPSRIDLRNVNKLIKEVEEHTVKHSTPGAYFKDLKKNKDDFSEYREGLNPWAVGCYSSQIRIKQKHRLLENEVYSLEKMATTATVQGLMEYPRSHINEAISDLMSSQFHDILPGTSIESVEEDSLKMMDHGLEITSRLKARAFFALATGQRKARNGEIPLMVYNQHPFKVKELIECEFNLPDFRSRENFTDVKVYCNDKSVPCQVEKEVSNHPLEWRKRVVFLAELKPNQMSRFDCRVNVINRKPVPALKIKGGKILFKTKDLVVLINAKTGLIDRYQIKGREYFGKNAFEPIVMADNEDSWGVTARSLRTIVGRFKLMSQKESAEFSGIKADAMKSIRIVEDGSVRSVVEVTFSYRHSFICQRYKLPKIGSEIEVESRVQWNEKDKMLKLSIPTFDRDCKYLGQDAYGIKDISSNGDESIAQKWICAISEKEQIALKCINNSTYSFDCSNKGLRLTLLRSPAYSAMPIENNNALPQDRYNPRIDQGQRLFRFWFNGGKIQERLEQIDREAMVKNETPYVLSFFPQSKGKKIKQVAILLDNVILITAMKMAEKGNDMIIRLFEPTGKSRNTILSLPFIKKKIKLSFTNFEVKTLKINIRTGKSREVNLLERKIKSHKDLENG